MSLDAILGILGSGILIKVGNAPKMPDVLWCVSLPEPNMLHLKIGAWKINFLLGQKAAYFQGRTGSFRECIEVQVTVGQTYSNIVKEKDERLNTEQQTLTLNHQYILESTHFTQVIVFLLGNETCLEQHGALVCCGYPFKWNCPPQR